MLRIFVHSSRTFERDNRKVKKLNRQLRQSNGIHRAVNLSLFVAHNVTGTYIERDDLCVRIQLQILGIDCDDAVIEKSHMEIEQLIFRE